MGAKHAAGVKAARVARLPRPPAPPKRKGTPPGGKQRCGVCGELGHKASRHRSAGAGPVRHLKVVRGGKSAIPLAKPAPIPPAHEPAQHVPGADARRASEEAAQVFMNPMVGRPLAPDAPATAVAVASPAAADPAPTPKPKRGPRRRMKLLRARVAERKLKQRLDGPAPPAPPPPKPPTAAQERVRAAAWAADPALERATRHQDGDPDIAWEDVITPRAEPPPTAPASAGGVTPLVVPPPRKCTPRRWLPTESLKRQARELRRKENRPHAADVELLNRDDLRPRERPECAVGEDGKPGIKRWWGTGSCPYVRCRYHLAIDYKPDTGSFKVLKGWDDGRGACALDLAEDGEHTLEQVGALTGVTRERARQIIIKALIATGMSAEAADELATAAPATEREDEDDDDE